PPPTPTHFPYTTLFRSNPEALRKEFSQASPNAKVNLQQLLETLASTVSEDDDRRAPLLMKAAEHMAIRFALERYQKGEVKVNARSEEHTSELQSRENLV